MKEEKFHPFFSYSKGCRKTAWETPEYLTTGDYEYIQDIIPLLESNKIEELRTYMFPTIFDGDIDSRRTRQEQTKDFFDRVIGWPEGNSYCPHIEPFCDDLKKTYWHLTGFGAIRGHLERLKNVKNPIDKK